MPVRKQTREQKSQKYILQNPIAFTLSQNKNIFCSLCSTEVCPDRKSTVDDHIKSKKHQTGLQIASQQKNDGKQEFLKPTKSIYTEKLVSALMSCDIPLHKIRNKEINEFFSLLGYSLPSETTIRRYLEEKYFMKLKDKIKDELRDKKVILMVDETSLRQKNYLNIMASSLDHPNKNYLIKTILLDSHANNEIVYEQIISCLIDYNIKNENFLLLISDAAKYMKLAGQRLKDKYHLLFHTYCFAHIIHNCSAKIQLKYKKINTLISTMKAITCKSSTTRTAFSIIGTIPSVMVQRFSSWLRAISFYSSHLPKIKEIMSTLMIKGTLLEAAYQACFDSGVFDELVEAQHCYSILINIMDKLEEGKYNLIQTFEILKELDLKHDPVGIKIYI